MQFAISYHTWNVFILMQRFHLHIGTYLGALYEGVYSRQTCVVSLKGDMRCVVVGRTTTNPTTAIHSDGSRFVHFAELICR